jgi:hypothetical protein
MQFILRRKGTTSDGCNCNWRPFVMLPWATELIVGYIRSLEVRKDGGDVL